MDYNKLYEKISDFIDLEQQDIELINSLFKYQSVTKGISLQNNRFG